MRPNAFSPKTELLKVKFVNLDESNRGRKRYDVIEYLLLPDQIPACAPHRNNGNINIDATIG